MRQWKHKLPRGGWGAPNATAPLMHGRRLRHHATARCHAGAGTAQIQFVPARVMGEQGAEAGRAAGDRATRSTGQH
jgi:hypothetical protein